MRLQPNLIPRRVVADWGTNDQLLVQVDLAGLSEGRLSVITAKIGQVPAILDVYWHR